ncbi:MAG: MerR family transcriptional regulator [Ilumatobacter sp.]|uniref:MerR family transcriptional regulator n=1 Tax=Ilumatobacter sp. TaxID=1967498 RepID=UPI0026284D13|nr:MerR family transcriptional regulator [Ilumatobacter sp.]MDJ0768743.1 MerR family transcriptional regulator [Ilumatobacter sp.]
MAEVKDASHLSIGEVLGMLLEEFPDVTISKIRFLESQGLISPERTSSGYRKFYDEDVELLRVILTEQRQNYLPLRVIKDRLDSGEIDPTGEHLRPGDDAAEDDQADESGTAGEAEADPRPQLEGDADAVDEAAGESVPAASIAAHPSSGRNGDPAEAPTVDEPDEPAPQLLPSVLLDRAELCSMVSMTDSELDQLESFGIVVPRESTGVALYGDDAVEIAKPACELLRAGVDARHLRTFRTAAEREVSLYEQLVTPRFRQRSPEARAEALEQLRRLDVLGGTIRAAMTRHALRHHFEQ